MGDTNKPILAVALAVFVPFTSQQCWQQQAQK
jgi:hypothetical protein